MTVYLLHFSQRYRHCQHYLGWTGRSVAERLQEHLDGAGNPLVHAASSAGSEIIIARTWEGADRNFERYLKNTKNVGKRICPICLGRTPTGKTEGR